MQISSQLRRTARVAALLLAALLFSPAVTQSASGQETPKVGVLFGGPKGSAAIAALVKAMEDLGYQDEKTVTLQFRYAEGKFDQLPLLAKELIELNPRLITELRTTP
jgi:putative tryptophan/tyrosine transport system substrate-binding protein